MHNIDVAENPKIIYFAKKVNLKSADNWIAHSRTSYNEFIRMNKVTSG